jgi:hypothetical protein
MSFISYSQEGKYKPFKMVIISPDTAIIDKSLMPSIDTIESNHLSAYYASIKQMEELLSINDYPESLMTEAEHKQAQQEIKSTLDTAKKYDSKVKEFRYFETISEYAAQVCQFYFNEYPPLSTFQLIEKVKLNQGNLSRIADSLKADYVLGFKNIHTEMSNGSLKIKLTTVVYSGKDKKILLEKETEGDENSYGDMWTCSDSLTCLLVTAVKSSTESVFTVISKRQHK